MEDSENLKKTPISRVRFGIGKELLLYMDEMVVSGREEGKEVRLPLAHMIRLTLMPGDPNPSKLILMADLDDDTSVLLAEGMNNAKDFRAMLPHLVELAPDLQLDPPDMSDQLWQAMNNRRAWNLTCLTAVILVIVIIFVLYLIVAFIGAHHI